MPSPAVSPTPLRVGVFCLLLGQAALYAQAHSPLSVLVWNERWLARPVAVLTGLSWKEWASHSAELIATLNHLCALLLFLAAGAILLPAAKSRWATPLLLSASLLMGLHACLLYEDVAWNPGELMERALFVLSPTALAAALRSGGRMPPAWAWLLLTATALTFAGHGLYAAGWWNVPGEWIFMTQSILGTSDAGTLLFLKTFGLLDAAAAIALLAPGKTRTAGLGYCVAWGLVTALARVLSHYDGAENWHGLNPWAWESLWRMAHFLVPLAFLLKNGPKAKSDAFSARSSNSSPQPLSLPPHDPPRSRTSARHPSAQRQDRQIPPRLA